MIFFSSFRWIFGLPRATSWYGVALIKTSFRLETFRASNLLQTHPFVEGWKRERERGREKKKDSQVDAYFLPRRRPPRRRRRGWSTILQFPTGNFLSTIFLYQALSDRQRGGGRNIFFVVNVFNVQKELARDGGREKALQLHNSPSHQNPDKI